MGLFVGESRNQLQGARGRGDNGGGGHPEEVRYPYKWMSYIVTQVKIPIKSLMKHQILFLIIL